MAKDGKSRRGFASMSPEKRRQIASLGGRSVAPENRSFSRDRTLAARAGSKGGQAVDADQRAYSKDRELAAESGRIGGKKAQAKRSKAKKKPAKK
ncbi:MAG: stress-induced protein [Alphaproteobacteria bacterium]|nr:stress-induced protein [Alphaproteobacteria bacterium]